MTLIQWLSLDDVFFSLFTWNKVRTTLVYELNGEESVSECTTALVRARVVVYTLALTLECSSHYLRNNFGAFIKPKGPSVEEEDVDLDPLIGLQSLTGKSSGQRGLFSDFMEQNSTSQ